MQGIAFPESSELWAANSDQWAVSSEPLAEPLLSDQFSRLMAYPAMRLFINRAQRVRADFDGIGQAAAAARLCQLVGGLPLALELAATWTPVLSVAEIVAEIEAGLGRLTTTLHDVPGRHRSLQTVIESSWQMLPASEQKLFRQLAVFRGGFTRAAAQTITNASLPQLMALVDRSFLRLDKDQRFRRHPLLLQFAQAQLAAHPEEQAQVAAAHADFLADFVTTQEKVLPGKDALAALAALASELENIRGAWQWALAAQAAPPLHRMVTGIGRFFADRSRYLEGGAFFEQSLAGLSRWPAAPASLQAKLLVELGSFWHENGRFAEAETILHQANDLAGQPNLLPTRLRALRYLADVIADQGDRKRARGYLEEAWSLCHSDGNQEQKLLLLWRLGILDTDDGAYEKAQTRYAEAMALAETLGNTLHIARLHNSMAIVANRQGDYKEAARQWQLARARFQAWGHEWGLAATSHNLAMAYWGLEQYDTALAMVAAAITAHEKIGHKRGVAGGLAVRATIYLALGQRPEARRSYYESLQLSQEVGATWLAVVALVDIAELEMSYGALDRAALLLTFVIQHPAAVASTLKNAQTLLEELRAELLPSVLAEAEAAAQHHTLDSLIAWLLEPGG